MARSLPEEIIFYEIWSRLSAKYLIRLTAVCKRWLSLIVKPGPMNSFLNRTSFNIQYNDIATPTSLVLFANPNTRTTHHHPRFTVLHNINESSSFSKCIDLIDKKIEHYNMYLVDSLHGLICFLHTNNTHCGSRKDLLYLWNPVTNLFKTVVRPPVSSSDASMCFVDCGLGYDPVNEDIKILLIEFSQYMVQTERNSLRIHLYSCKTETWKDIKDETLPANLFKFVRGMKSKPNHAYVNFFGSSPATLVAFDFHDEVFMQLPCWKPFLDEVSCDPLYIECVSTAVYSDKCKKKVVVAFDEIQGTWSQQYIVPDSLNDYNLQLSYANGDIIVDDHQGNLLLFKAESSHFKNIFDPGAMFSYRNVMPYTESLINIKGMQELNRENINKCFENRELNRYNDGNNKKSRKVDEKRKREDNGFWQRRNRRWCC